MRRRGRGPLAAAVAFLALAAGPPPPADEFFLVSSIDLARGTIVVKRPTEVTLLLRVDERTRFRAENGRAMKLSELKAGDTVFVVAEKDREGRLVARSIREGVMTLPELRRRYLRTGG